MSLNSFGQMREIVALHVPEPPTDQYSLYYYHLNRAKLLAAIKTVKAVKNF